MVGAENPESLLYKGFNTHPTHLTHQFYGGASLWVNEGQSNHAKDPMRSLRICEGKPILWSGKQNISRWKSVYFQDENKNYCLTN
jgi:hypothetical protein